MKIEYASNDNYLLTGRNDPVTKTVKEVLEQASAGEKPVQITISKEGYECYRSSLSNLEGFTHREEPDSQIMELYGKAILDKNRISFMFQDLGRELLDTKKVRNADSYLESYFNAYTTLYDQISREYAEGTRDIWALETGNGEMHFRQVTKEDELEALDVAYENFAEGLGKYLKIAQEQDEILREHIAQLARDSGKYSSRKREENSDIKPIIKTEDIYQTMLLTRNNFKNKYSIFKSQDTIKKEVVDMIHQLFNRKVF